MTTHAIREILPAIDSYLDEDGDIHSLADDPDGFEAVGPTTFGQQADNESAIVDGREDLSGLESVGDVEGVSVDLGERAINLLAAVDSYNHASMLSGFLRSNNRTKIAQYGGEDAIRRAITRSNDRGRKALRRGTGIDAMLANPEMAADEYGAPYDELKATDDLVAYNYEMRTTMTAAGAIKADGASAKEKIDKHKEIARNRAEFRRRMARQVIPHA
jgi:hypothetical protein